MRVRQGNKMDEFLRAASHSIVTTVLLVIWSGLLLGVTWKVLNQLGNGLRRLLPGKTFPTVKVLLPQRPRLSVSSVPVLVANNPEQLLQEAPRPLLPTPQDDLLVTALFQPHYEDTTL
jgi:hypothetical protein